jgi:hypothetical protein
VYRSGLAAGVVDVLLPRICEHVGDLTHVLKEGVVVSRDAGPRTDAPNLFADLAELLFIVLGVFA